MLVIFWLNATVSSRKSQAEGAPFGEMVRLVMPPRLLTSTVAGIEVRRNIAQDLTSHQVDSIEVVDGIRLIENFAVEQREAHLSGGESRVDGDGESFR